MSPVPVTLSFDPDELMAPDQRLSAYLNGVTVAADGDFHALSWTADSDPGSGIALDGDTFTLDGGGKLYLVQAQLSIRPQHGTTGVEVALNSTGPSSDGLNSGLARDLDKSGALAPQVFGFIAAPEGPVQLKVNVALIDATAAESVSGGGIDIARIR